MKYAVELQERQKALQVTNGEPRRTFLAASGSRLAAVFAVLVLMVVPTLTPSLGGLVHAQALATPGSIWKIERTSTVGVPFKTFGLEILRLPPPILTGFGPYSTNIMFNAKYVTTPTPGINTTSLVARFDCELTIRDGEAIHIRQSHEDSGYVAYHSGRKVPGTNVYKGQFYDNAGYVGDFTLTKIR